MPKGRARRKRIRKTMEEAEGGAGEEMEEQEEAEANRGYYTDDIPGTLTSPAN